ncbi:cytochrome P450 [Nemania sp. FL0031]|nr:cytochrome P450 [Nemania sp. FL0031]
MAFLESAQQLPQELREAFHLALQWHILTLCGALVMYYLVHAAWNLSSAHPLSSIPGPRLAAASYLPEFYYDVVKFGKYTRKIQELHQTYGPIVRISPNEVHCSDTAFSDEIYALSGRKRDKPVHQIRGGGAIPGAIFSTAGHELHRMRRAAMAKFFSRTQVLKLEPKIRRLSDRLCEKILAEGKRPFDVTTAYSCFSSDVVSDYAFGSSFNFLNQESWQPNFRGPLYSIIRPVFMFRFFPLSRYLSLIVFGSQRASKLLPPEMQLLVKTMTFDIPNQIASIKADIESGVREKNDTVFGSLLESDLPEEEKSIARLTDEAAALLTAGSETVSWALTVITYHLLDKPQLLERLKHELSGAIDSSGQLPSWSSLEKLPYLSAVIMEGLRLSYGLSGRSARVPVEEDLVYRGIWRGEPVQYVIPKGFAIGMSPALLHHDEGLFPNSHTFDPERWLHSDMRRNKEPEHHLLTFSKGSRACLGINLAYCELHLVLATLSLRVLPHMKLYNTTEDDVKYDHDMFNPMPHPRSQGVRAIVV